MEQFPALLILDADGTLVRTHSGHERRQTADDWEWIPGRLEMVRALHSTGVRIAIATNQGGVSAGRFAAAEMCRQTERIAHDIAADVFVQVSFGVWLAGRRGFDRSDPLRKPRPGMLTAAMAHFGIEPGRTLMVGDRPEDSAAARAAGCRFSWADAFFRGLGNSLAHEVA